MKLVDAFDPGSVLTAWDPESVMNSARHRGHIWLKSQVLAAQNVGLCGHPTHCIHTRAKLFRTTDSTPLLAGQFHWLPQDSGKN